MCEHLPNDKISASVIATDTRVSGNGGAARRGRVEISRCVDRSERGTTSEHVCSKRLVDTSSAAASAKESRRAFARLFLFLLEARHVAPSWSYIK